MRRSDWTNLNGLWDYAVSSETKSIRSPPSAYDGKILVPFAIESSLSGVARRVKANEVLWYRRTVSVTPTAANRTLLHFGAVDWRCDVRVNGQHVGRHAGGYDAFTLDITDALDGKDEAEIIVRVEDPTDSGTQPCGKQRAEPKGIWYTPVTGIWQTVWLEVVPERSIRELVITPDLASGTVAIGVNVRGDPNGCTFVCETTVDGKTASVRGVAGQVARLRVPVVKPWSPESPHLYDLKVTLSASGREIDTVSSYFGLRSIVLGKDQNGVTRILLNGKPYFQYGPLDQGYWPDGLYTAPTEAAMLHDLEVTKRLGFNMVRKHVKVEPARWYTHCDRIGLLVWQDLPNGGTHLPWPRDSVDGTRDPAAAAQYRRELKALIETHRNHPSIVVWVPFNEAWGQFDTDAILSETAALDPSRLVDAASGGNDFSTGHIKDIHDYPGPKASPAEPHRAVVLGEYGGLGLPLPGHTWQNEKNWGYRSFKDKKSLLDAYVELTKALRPFAATRLSAAIYTQTTDVEVEVNGLMSYDREVLKFDETTFRKATQRLYAPIRPLSNRERADLYTLAHWTFDEGNPGTSVPYVSGDGKSARPAAADRSGHKNHLYAYGAHTTPRYAQDVPAATIPLTGRANTGSLDDTRAGPGNTPTQDLFTDPGRSRPHMDIVDTAAFRDWTLEASFRLAALGRAHVLVGKDGETSSDRSAPMQLGVGEDNRVFAHLVDETGVLRKVISREPVTSRSWYHVAVRSNGKNVELLLRTSNGKWNVESSSPIAGRVWVAPGTWTIGRGFHAGKIGQDARAFIDEVRISTAGLDNEQLLFRE